MDIYLSIYKNYSCYKSLWNHNKKFHNKDVNNVLTNVIIPKINVNNVLTSNKNLICKYCKNIFSYRNSRWRHEKICKKKEEINKIEQLEQKVNELESKLQTTIINNNTNNNSTLNNHLIDIIVDKSKAIEELQLNNKIILNKEVKTTETLTLNNIVIISRIQDNYINATQLCQAGNK